MRLKSFAFGATAFVLSASFALAQADQTLTGTISDTMCGKKHMMAGKTAAECTRECVKEGSDYALVVGDKVYTLKGDGKTIDKYAGAKVTVKGKVSGSTVTMASIKTAQ